MSSQPQTLQNSSVTYWHWKSSFRSWKKVCTCSRRQMRWFDSLSGSDVVIVLACVSSVDCLDPMCSGHGTCHHGECHCNPGWGGISCDILKSTCPEQCSSHGTFNTDSGVCICEANWTGADCSIGQNVFLLSFLQQKNCSCTSTLGLQLICHVGF